MADVSAPPQPHGSTGLKIFSIVVLGLVLLGFGIHFWNNRPVADLGPKLEYVGKQNYGCWLLCDSSPSSTYYFATDMTPEELGSYFKKEPCSISNSDAPRVFGADYNFYSIGCGGPSLPAGGFGIDYYTNVDVVVQKNRLKPTGKTLVVSIDKKDYAKAKASL